MTTITDIRDDLIKVFNGLRDGTVDIKEAVRSTTLRVRL
jgi:hypothetical protein